MAQDRTERSGARNSNVCIEATHIFENNSNLIAVVEFILPKSDSESSVAKAHAYIAIDRHTFFFRNTCMLYLNSPFGPLDGTCSRACGNTRMV